jgi:hypothetical protein
VVGAVESMIWVAENHDVARLMFVAGRHVNG